MTRILFLLCLLCASARAQVQSPQIVTSVAQLVTLTPTARSVVVIGYRSIGDGGGGIFHWDSTNTASTNLGTIFKPSSLTPGRWIRDYSGAINVKWFGSVGDGVTDDTAAITAAYNAISSTDGGELFFPIGDWKFNLVIDKPNVTITSISHARDFVGTMHSRFTPSITTNAVIKVGNDTGFVKGVVIQNATFDGKNAGTMGIEVAGGGFECTIKNAVVNYFKTCLKVQGGTTYPGSVVRVQNTDGHPSNVDGARGWMIKNTTNYPTSWTTEINFTDCHWDGPSSGSDSYMAEVDSCEIKMLNCYLDVSAGHGIKFSHTLTPLPKINASESNLDGGSPTNVVIEGYTNDRIFTGLKSFNFQIAGSWKDLDGTIIPPLPQQIDTILGKSSATRGTHILLGEDSGSFSISKLQFRDQVHNYNPDIFVQGASVNYRADAGGSLRFADILGTVWAEVNANGYFFYGSGVNTNTVPYLDSFKRIQSSAVTPTELGYLSGVTSPLQTRRITVVQAADQSVTSSTTLVNSTDLTVAVEANKTYTWEANLQFNDAGGVPGVQAAVTGPTSPTKAVINIMLDNTASGGVAFNSRSSFGSMITASGLATGLSFIKVWGTLINGANAGNITIQFAQNASDAAAVTLKAGSTLTVERIN